MWKRLILNQSSAKFILPETPVVAPVFQQRGGFKVTYHGQEIRGIEVRDKLSNLK